MTAKSVLIVEDDADIRESLRDAFEDAGYSVRCAANGREGLEALRQERPSAIVLDLIMPVMTGNELYEHIRADPALASIPVVISTSDPTRAPSGVLIMKKPFTLRALLSMVDKLC